MSDPVVDRHGVPIAEGCRVKADWPNAVGTVTAVTEWDGEYLPDGGVRGYPPRVHVRWDVPLSNDAGQVWQDEWVTSEAKILAMYVTGPDECDELEVVNGV